MSWLGWKRERARGHGRNRAKFWRQLGFINIKRSGAIAARKAAMRSAKTGKPPQHSMRVRESIWQLAQALASEASERTGRWITAHEMLTPVLDEWAARESARIRLEQEYAAEVERIAKLEAKAAAKRRR